MATIGYAELPIPGGGDSPTTPGHLAALAAAIDPLLWQPVTNLADRNTRLAGAPQRTVAVAPDGTTWVKTSSSTNAWVTIWEPVQAWQTLTLASGYTAGETIPKVRIDRGKAYLRGRIALTSGALIPTSGVKIASVPTAAIPTELVCRAVGCSLSGDALVGAGRLEVYSPDQDGNAAGGRGSIVWFSQDGGQDGGTPGVTWVDIGCSYWID
ncbi:hypothetical protein [Streptomyces griseorubiginosus]|uniref:hypothetical protein n=1 Tax=Streptomyces griseorubiginosus TaxID=67304 RepID=UPI0036E369A8